MGPRVVDAIGCTDGRNATIAPESTRVEGQLEARLDLRERGWEAARIGDANPSRSLVSLG